MKNRILISSAIVAFIGLGICIAGRFNNRGELSPGRALFSIVDNVISTVVIVTMYIIKGPIPALLNRTVITASCAEQGITNWSMAVTIDFSLLVPKILVVMFAIVIQPKPSSIGITALPFNPKRVKNLSSIVARRGR